MKAILAALILCATAPFAMAQQISTEVLVAALPAPQPGWTRAPHRNHEMLQGSIAESLAIERYSGPNSDAEFVLYLLNGGTMGDMMAGGMEGIGSEERPGELLEINGFPFIYFLDRVSGMVGSVVIQATQVTSPEVVIAHLESMDLEAIAALEP